MKKVYALCLLTLAAVVFDIVFFHSRSVQAQANQTVRVERVLFDAYSAGRDAPATGRVVGFQCIDTPGGPQCFVASTFAPGRSE